MELHSDNKRRSPFQKDLKLKNSKKAKDNPIVRARFIGLMRLHTLNEVAVGRGKEHANTAVRNWLPPSIMAMRDLCGAAAIAYWIYSDGYWPPSWYGTGNADVPKCNASTEDIPPLVEEPLRVEMRHHGWSNSEDLQYEWEYPQNYCPRTPGAKFEF